MRPMTHQEMAQYALYPEHREKLATLVQRLSERLNMSPQDVIFKIQFLAQFGQC